MTGAPPCASSSLRSVRLVCVVGAVLALSGTLAVSALGDADPPSDLLLGQDYYLPYQRVSPDSAKQVKRVTAESVAAGYPVQVAIIQSRQDLGAVPTFFGRPKQYATFLYRELALVRSLTNKRKYGLLVVMPAGFGLAGPPLSLAGSLKGISVPSDGKPDGLAHAAVLGVEKLAGASGHPIKPVGEHSSGLSLRWIVLGIAVAVLVALAVAAAVDLSRRRRGRARPSPG